MIASIRENDELQMNAYCDGELDPASAIEFERRLADDESLKARYNRLLSLRRAVRSLPQYEVPPGLRASINSKLDADRPDRANRDIQSWLLGQNFEGKALVGLNPNRQGVGWKLGLSIEEYARDVSELDVDDAAARRHPLAGAQVEGHASPAPIVDRGFEGDGSFSA